MQWGRGMAVIKIKGMTLIISASQENGWGGDPKFKLCLAYRVSSGQFMKP